MNRSVASLPVISQGQTAFWPVYFNFADQDNNHEHAAGMGVVRTANDSAFVGATPPAADANRLMNINANGLGFYG